MGQSHTLSNQDAFLKEVYTEDEIAEQSYDKNPFFAMTVKDNEKTVGGKYFVLPVEISHPGGSSASFAKAKLNATTSNYRDFIINRTTQYQHVKVDHELMLATDKKSEAFMKEIEQFNRGFRGFGQKLGRRMYRTQGGAIAKLSIASTNTTTLTFADQASVFNFHIGQTICFAAADGTGSLRDSGDTTTVTEINHVSGTVTIADNLGTQISGVATTDYVFVDGEFGACMNGLEDWLPVDDRDTKLAASFNNVVRSVAANYLGGNYLDGTSYGTLDEVMIKLVGLCGMFGAETDTIFANTAQITELMLIKNSKIKIIDCCKTNMKSETTGRIVVGFSGFKCMVGDKIVEVYGDRNCPTNRLYALQMNTWKVLHAGEMINWVGESYTDQRIWPSREEDAAESMLASYCNLGCSAPGWNGVAKINPVSFN
jgi:hypothetical protein